MKIIADGLRKNPAAGCGKLGGKLPVRFRAAAEAYAHSFIWEGESRRRPATPSILSDAAYRARFGRDNPSTALLAAHQAGVSIEVCSYALAGQRIARDAVVAGVQVDLAAMVTLVNLQVRGCAVITG